MVAISSSFVPLATFASALAAPAAGQRDAGDALVETNILSNNPNDVSSDAHGHLPIAFSSVTDKSPTHNDGSSSILKVNLLGDHNTDHTFYVAPLLDVDILRRDIRTTGDLISGPDSDKAMFFADEFWSLRRATHNDDFDTSLFDVDLSLSEVNHYAHYVDGTSTGSVAADSAGSAAADSARDSSSPAATAKFSSTSRQKLDTSPKFGSGFMFQPSIKETAEIDTKSCKTRIDVKTKSKVKSKSRSKSKPQSNKPKTRRVRPAICPKSKSKSKSKIQASVGGTKKKGSKTDALFTTPTPAPVTHDNAYGDLLDITLDL